MIGRRSRRGRRTGALVGGATRLSGLGQPLLISLSGQLSGPVLPILQRNAHSLLHSKFRGETDQEFLRMGVVDTRLADHGPQRNGSQRRGERPNWIGSTSSSRQSTAHFRIRTSVAKPIRELTVYDLRFRIPAFDRRIFAFDGNTGGQGNQSGTDAQGFFVEGEAAAFFPSSSATFACHSAALSN